MPKPDPSHLKKGSSRTKFPSKTPDGATDTSSQENVNRIITFGSMPSYREDKLQELKRQQVLQLKDASCSDGEDLLDETSAFIELSPNNLSKVPEKGILKQRGVVPVRSSADKWSGDDASQSDNQDQPVDTLTEVERTLKSLNGYHEDILEALQTVSSHRPITESQGSSPQDIVKKTFSDCDHDYGHLVKGSMEHLEENIDTSDVVPPCGPIRIRNLEDLLRKLEHQPIHGPSPAGSDLRLSEPEADHHYHRGVERADSASGTESQLEPGLQFYLGRKRSHFQEEEEEDFDEEGSIEEEGLEEEGEDYLSHQFVRSASEEALPMTDYGSTYERNLNTKQSEEKTLKRDYVPSPPSDELYDGLLYDDKGSFFPPAAASGRGAQLPLNAPPSSSSSTSGSQPPSGIKKKGKKKFPEYKV